MDFIGILLILLLYWAFIWSFFAAGLAHRLGRGDASDIWAIVGFFLGPLGLAILYSRGKKEPEIFFPVTDEERRKWDTLCRVDRHIALAATKAREVSESCERDLMLMYFALSDRQQLPHILKTAIEAAEARKREAARPKTLITT